METLFGVLLKHIFTKKYRLREQINGASGSIMDNTAEGFGTGGNKEFIRFLGYSRGFCGESKAELLRVYRRQHISEEIYHTLNHKAQDLIDQLSKLIHSLKKSYRRGSRVDKLCIKNRAQHLA